MFESWAYPLTGYLISDELLYFFDLLLPLLFFQEKEKTVPMITLSTYLSLTTDILMAKLLAFYHCFNIIMSTCYFYEECVQGK